MLGIVQGWQGAKVRVGQSHGLASEGAREGRHDIHKSVSERHAEPPVMGIWRIRILFPPKELFFTSERKCFHLV